MSLFFSASQESQYIIPGDWNSQDWKMTDCTRYTVLHYAAWNISC